LNIFILDNDLKKCVEYYVDKHCVKMILEHTQILCSVHHISGSKLEIPYRKTHQHHPVVKWATKSLSNYNWLIKLTESLCKEYSYRYDKIHKCEKVLKWAKENTPNIPELGLTPFAQAMPDDCKNENTVVAYRNYYRKHKRHLFAWKRREPPYWIKDGES